MDDFQVRAFMFSDHLNVVVLQRTAKKKCTKLYNAGADVLLQLTKPILTHRIILSLIQSLLISSTDRKGEKSYCTVGPAYSCAGPLKIPLELGGGGELPFERGGDARRLS